MWVFIAPETDVGPSSPLGCSWLGIQACRVLDSLCAYQMPDFLSGRVREGWDQGPLPHMLVPGSSQVVLGVPDKSGHLQPKCDSRAETEVATARPVRPLG